MLLRLMALVTAVVHMVSSQGGGGTILDQGNAAASQSVIVTPRTRAFLSCESGDIVVKVNFTLPFRGLMYAHRSRSSPCRVHGTGGQYYELRIPLKGCGTWQESSRVFVNNITIRFHSALELEEDETKTVVCRYPPPLTQPPGSIIEPKPITSTASPTRVATARLSEIEILILICLLLFLSLLTLGIGIAYFCLKRRHVRIIRRHKPPTSTAPPSQITRLSSSNIPSSSVLGHTVRIPRAVPYSGRVLSSAMSMSASPIEEDYPTSSSAEATSAEETSVSTTSSEDQSRNLLYPKAGPKSFLLIPKAILRKAGSNRWRTPPAVQHSERTGSAASTSAKVLEMEDQTVTTVLEPENNFEDGSYWTLKQRESTQQDAARSTATTKSQITKMASPVPVYAQVDKNKKNIAMDHQEVILQKKTKSTRQHPPPLPAPGIARRQRQVVTETPEERKTSEEVTKNTTVTTSVRREVKETRVLSPSLMEDLRDAVAKRDPKSYDASGEPSGLVKNTDKLVEKSSALSTKATALNLQKPPKSILIRDVSDVYLTTTVETELRELTTKVSKDVVERHEKVDEPDSRLPKKVDSLNEPLMPDTLNWNVIIRHRSPEVPLQESTDLEASGESNGESVESSPPLPQEPQFQVKIRTIPPEELQSKKLEPMMSIPPLEMPSSVGKLREAMMPNLQEGPGLENDNKLIKNSVDLEENKVKSSPPPQQRTVRWTKDTKDASSTVSSSDSFQSSESLRERSSSEVLEVAPTLPSQQRKQNQPSMLERSTSEIVTSPEDHSRWVGGVVPVLESLSPEFLANIPVVAQGGFFNTRKQTSTSAESGKDTKKS